jgi:hypothetical protein
MKVLCSQELASPPHKGIVPYQVTAKVSAPGVIAPFPNLTSLDVGTHKGVFLMV